MFAFAVSNDVAARWRALTPGEVTLVDVLLEDASDMIRVRWPDIDDRITAGEVDRKTLTRIVSAMVRRAVMNRGVEGIASQQTTAGPFSQNVTLSNADGNLYLTEREIADLTAPAPRGKMGWLV